jgi:hypothetical protein
MKAQLARHPFMIHHNTMRKLLLFLFLIIYSLPGFSQHTDLVSIIQKHTKHHLKLFGINHTKTSKIILVELNGVGFRRRTFKPIYKTIGANDILLLSTLVKRSNTPSKLNYKLYYDTSLELYNLQQSKK